MKKYGTNLDDVFIQQEYNLSQKTILQIGIRILEIFEKVHATGYIYNDLKLDNIMIGNSDDDLMSSHEIRLIDFGFASKYISHVYDN